MTIKEILDKLGVEDRRRLIYAFDNHITQHIELSNKKFVGVNVESIPYLKIEQKIGAWASGVIKK